MNKAIEFVKQVALGTLVLSVEQPRRYTTSPEVVAGRLAAAKLLAAKARSRAIQALEEAAGIFGSQVITAADLRRALGRSEVYSRTLIKVGVDTGVLEQLTFPPKRVLPKYRFVNKQKEDEL